MLLGAEIDSQEIYNAQEDFCEGRGAVFLVELDRTLELLRTHPEIAPLFHGKFRKKLMIKLPYCLLYRVHGDRIFVSAIASVYGDRDRLVAKL